MTCRKRRSRISSGALASRAETARYLNTMSALRTCSPKLAKGIAARTRTEYQSRNLTAYRAHDARIDNIEWDRPELYADSANMPKGRLEFFAYAATGGMERDARRFAEINASLRAKALSAPGGTEAVLVFLGGEVNLVSCSRLLQQAQSRRLDLKPLS